MKKTTTHSVEKGLEITEELLSFHAINPFIKNISSARSYMSSSHVSQSLPIHYGDEHIIQTGLETQFAQNTFSKKTHSDVRVIKVIPRYRGISSTTVTKVVSYLIIVEDLETGEFDFIDIPYYHSTHTMFGFKYQYDKDFIESLKPGTILPKDTTLADSPTVRKNKGFANGVNANLALISLPETAEDGMIISKRLAEKMSYDVFETKVMEFGSDSFPLNIYGDENHYKAFPEIGELVNSDSILMVLRKYDSRLSPALTSVKDVREFNPIFDVATYVKGPGDILDVCNDKVLTSEVVDIKVYTSPKYKRDVYTGTSDIVDKYVNGLKQYHMDIVDCYNEICKEHYRRYKDNNVKVSDQFHRLIIESMAVANPDGNKISYSYRNEQLDLYRVEITLRSRIVLRVGNKCSDGFGIFGC